MIKAVLTIDDIASKNTPAIVDYLQEKGIPAIMFAWGENVLKHYEEAVYALQHGVIVGNHSFSHPHFSEISFEECIAEIEKCEDILEKLYKDAGVDRRFRPFRFPYGDKGGDKKDAIQKYLSENGFNKVDDTKISFEWWKEAGMDKDIDTFWTFDFMEYCIRPGSTFTKDDVMNRIHDMSDAPGAGLLKDGGYHFIIIHAHDETEELLPGYYRMFLDHVTKNGVEFVKPEFI